MRANFYIATKRLTSAQCTTGPRSDTTVFSEIQCFDDILGTEWGAWEGKSCVGMLRILHVDSDRPTIMLKYIHFRPANGRRRSPSRFP